MSAIDYIHLVGKRVRMERPSTADEKSCGAGKTVGGSGLVVIVADTPGGGVEVMWDYGMGFTIRPDDVGWKFVIGYDEELWAKEVEKWTL